MPNDFAQPSTPSAYGLVTATVTLQLPAPTTQDWHHKAKETDTASPTYGPPPSSATIVPGASASAESQMLWDRVTHGARIAIVLAAILGIILVIVFSMWFCCNCCGRRKKRRSQDRAVENGVLPMHTIQNRGVEEAAATGRPAGDAPPSYEEVVPPQHQRLAGGIPNINTTSEEDDAVVSDGKTPLSEIPFEDVVLDNVSSQSSGSRMFDQVHHGAGGDTRGHTNT